jgi:signal transduction histidine kinase
MMYGVDKINAFALAMLNQAELEDLLWSIAQGVGDIMEFDDCVIYLRNGDKLVQMAAFGVKNPKDREIFERIEIPVGEGIVGNVALTGEAEIVTDTRDDPRYINDQYDGLSELAVPVVYEGETIAVIDSESNRANDYSEFEQALLQVIANIASPRIASAQYQLKLKQTQVRLERSNNELKQSLNELAKNQAALIQSEKMASVGVLSAGIAHEINTPLGFSISNLNTVLEDFLPELTQVIHRVKADPDLPASSRALLYDDEFNYVLDDLSALTQETLNGLKSAKQIMLDLKRFSREDSDIFILSDINKGIESTLNILRNELKTDCEVTLDLHPLPEVSVNIGKLNQVFMNLIMNAKQAISERGKIAISTQFIDDWIEVKVSDTGCGIPKSHLKDIFTPFYTTKPVGEGTGLGLAICYRIICQEHNGKLSVDSDNQGTVFTIQLPVKNQVERTA